MNAIARTETMLIRLNEKIETEMNNLKIGFEQMNFELITRASDELNLYAHRGYDLASTEPYAQFKRTTREEFLRLIQSEFTEAGIDMQIPDTTRTGGQAVYFKAFGQRLGSLYGEHKSVMNEIGKDNIEFLHLTLELKKERLGEVQEKLAKANGIVLRNQKLLENPELILTDDFKELREGLGYHGFHFHNDKIQRFFERFASRSMDWRAAKKLIEKLNTDEGRERMENLIRSYTREQENYEREISMLTKEIERLASSVEQFEPVLTSYFMLLHKYNIPYQGKSD